MRIEREIDRARDADLVEITVCWIKKEISLGRSYCTGHSQNSGTFFEYPLVPDFHRRSWRWDNPPIGRKIFRHKNLGDTIWPFQIKRFVAFIGQERLTMDKNFESRSRLMFTRVDSAHAWRIPAPSVSP